MLRYVGTMWHVTTENNCPIVDNIFNVFQRATWHLASLRQVSSIIVLFLG